MYEYEWLTEAEVAKWLRCSPLTLKRWRDTGDGPPPHRIGRRMIRYQRVAVEQYLEDCKCR